MCMALFCIASSPSPRGLQWQRAHGESSTVADDPAAMYSPPCRTAHLADARFRFAGIKSCPVFRASSWELNACETLFTCSGGAQVLTQSLFFQSLQQRQSFLSFAWLDLVATTWRLRVVPQLPRERAVRSSCLPSFFSHMSYKSLISYSRAFESCSTCGPPCLPASV
jgi:hypothetical protein